MTLRDFFSASITASTFPGLTVIRQSALNIDIINNVWISVYENGFIVSRKYLVNIGVQKSNCANLQLLVNGLLQGMLS